MAIRANYPDILPSLNLDFANTKELDPRITFARTTTATYYDGKTTAKAEENLFQYSEQFDNAWWSKDSSTCTANQDTAPDGTTTADLIQFNIQYASVTSNFNLVSGTQYTISLWCRVATGTRTFHWYDNAGGGPYGNFTATTTWARYSATFTAGSNGKIAALQDRNASGFVNTYIWGAQLEQRSSVTAYTATTSAPITNYIPVLQTAAAGQARFDHNPTTGESLGLLIEEQRTNNFTYSAAFDNAAWSLQNVTITPNISISPDGTLTADKLVEGSGANQDPSVYRLFSFTNATSYTYSVYAKAGERTRLNLFSNFGFIFDVTFDLSAGTATGTGTSIQSVGNGWYRCIISGTATATANSNVQNRIYPASGSNPYTGNGFSGIFLWGAQLEAGSFATSYIPTTSATVTRNADAASMTGTNFSSWYNTEEGSFYTDIQITKNIVIVFEVSTGSALGHQIIYSNVGGTPSYYEENSGINYVSIGTRPTSGKIAICYKTNDFAFSANGGSVSTDTSGVVPLYVSRLDIGRSLVNNSNWANVGIKKISYYPKRLSNTELQALSSV